MSFGKLTLTVNLVLGPLCPMRAGTQVAGTTCARLGPQGGLTFSVGTVGGEWVGLWGTASSLELAELSPSSSGDRAEGKASNSSLGVLGKGSVPKQCSLTPTGPLANTQ